MKKALRKIGKFALYLGVTLFAVVVLVVLGVLGATQTSAGLGRGSALLAELLNTQLNGHFDVSFEKASIGFSGVEGIDATLRAHPDGKLLIEAEDLTLSWSAVKLLRSLSAPTIEIEVPDVVIARAHLDATDVEALAHAFGLRNPGEPSQVAAPEPVVAFRISHAKIEALTAQVPGPVEPIHVVANNVEGSVLVDNDVVIDASLPTLTARAKLSVEHDEVVARGAGEAALSLNRQGVLLLVAQYSGDFGGVFAEANAAMLQEDWWALANLHGEPDAIATLGLGWQPGVPLDVALAVVGDSTASTAVVSALGEQSDVRAAADITFEPLAVRGVVQGHALNPQALYVGAETGRLSLDGRVHYSPKELAVALNLSAGSYGPMSVPSARIKLDAQQLKAFQLDVVLADESRAHLTANATLGERVVAHATFESRALPREASQQLNNRVVIDDVHASLDVVASREFVLQSARAQASARRVQVPAASLVIDKLATAVTLDDVSRREQIVGSLSASRVTVAQLQLHALAADITPAVGGNRLRATSNVRVRPDAPIHKLNVDVGVNSVQPVEIRRLRVVVAAEEPIHLDVERVAQTNAGWQIEQAHLHGLGQLDADAVVGASVKLSAVAEQLDLARLSELLAPIVPPLNGKLTGRSELLFTGLADLRGFVDVAATELGWANVQGVQAALQVTSDGTVIGANVQLSQGGTEVELVASDVVIADLRSIAELPEAASLSQLNGSFDLSVATTGAELAAKLEQPGLNQEVTLQSNVRLSNATDEPLRFASKTTASLRRPQPHPNVGSTSKDVHFEWTSEFEQGDPTWRNQVRVTAADIATLSGQAALQLAVASVPLRELPSALLAAPIQAQVGVTRIDLSLLPRDLPLPGLEGTLEANGELLGTLGSPQARLDLTVSELQVQSIEQSLAVTVRATAEYVQNSMQAEYAVTHDGAKVASGLVFGNWETQHYRVDTRLDDISLGCLPYVRDYGIEGHLTGYVELDVSEEVAARTYLLGRGFKVNAAEVPYWSLQGNVGAGKGNAVLSLIESDGSARVTVEAQEMGETLADLGPLKVTAAMKNFQLRPLLGFTGGVVRDGSGIANGNLEAEFLRQDISAHGSLVIRDGSLLIPVLGREFTGLQATIKAEPGKLSINEVKGRFGMGRFKGDGRLAYDQDSNLKAHVDLRIPRSAPIPLAREGRDVAQMSGRVEVVAHAKGGAGLSSEIRLSNINIDVSEESEQVLSLDSPDYAVFGYRNAAGAFKTYGSEDVKPAPTSDTVEPMTLEVKLGREVWVHRGQGTFAALEGGIKLLLGNDIRSEGALTIPEGRIDVMGRVFDVQPSTVTFGGDDIDPEVVAEANWLSPSGHTVIASFRGPVSSGKMQLRSEPALSYGEILNVLLFDDPTGAPDSGAPPTATSLAGTLVGAGLGRTLSDLTDLDLQANVETTESGSTRPEIGIRISPRLALQVSYNPQPVVSLTEPPDQAQVSLDWRITKGWSLESKLGNQGSASADLSWQFRY